MNKQARACTPWLMYKCSKEHHFKTSWLWVMNVCATIDMRDRPKKVHRRSRPFWFTFSSHKNSSCGISHVFPQLFCRRGFLNFNPKGGSFWCCYWAELLMLQLGFSAFLWISLQSYFPLCVWFSLQERCRKRSCYGTFANDYNFSESSHLIWSPFFLIFCPSPSELTETIFFLMLRMTGKLIPLLSTRFNVLSPACLAWDIKR